MYTPSARRGTIFLVVILLVISILLEQAIAGIFPLLSQLGGVRPMIVFLDIPLETPVAIDWLPVGFIFMIFYSIVVHRGARDTAIAVEGASRFSRGWAVLGRWWLLLILMLTGGGIYYGLSGFLPRDIRKGIESFGMRADLTLPYPSGETIHLNGSMIMLVFFVLGWRLLINKALPLITAQPDELPAVPQPSAIRTPGPMVTPPPPPRMSVEIPAIAAAPPIAAIPAISAIPAIPATPAISAAAPLPARGRIAMRIPEPVEVKAPTSRSCVYVAMPAGFVRKRSSYPCVVDGGIRPSMHQKDTAPLLWQS